MKKLAVVALVALVGTGSAFGGVVGFVAPDGPGFTRGPNSLTVNRGVVQPGAVNDIMLSINPDFAAYDAAVIFFGSNTVPFTDFDFVPEFTTALPTTLEGPFVNPGFDVYRPSEVYGAAAVSPGQVTLDVLQVGLLDIDLTGLVDGTYTVVFDSVVDGGLSGVGNRGVLEPLMGTFTVTIVPEPATLSLIGLGLLATVLRRRKAA